MRDEPIIRFLSLFATARHVVSTFLIDGVPQKTSLTSGAALVSPAIFNAVALDSEEPIEDLVFPASVPRAMFPAARGSTLQKGAWHGPTVQAAWREPSLLDKVTESTCWHLNQVCP